MADADAMACFVFENIHRAPNGPGRGRHAAAATDRRMILFACSHSQMPIDTPEVLIGFLRRNLPFRADSILTSVIFDPVIELRKRHELPQPLSHYRYDIRPFFLFSCKESEAEILVKKLFQLVDGRRVPIGECDGLIWKFRFEEVRLESIVMRKDPRKYIGTYGAGAGSIPAGSRLTSTLLMVSLRAFTLRMGSLRAFTLRVR